MPGELQTSYCHSTSVVFHRPVFV
ncbi:hypothetical protein OIU84_023368, partial [Salix udensis]